MTDAGTRRLVVVRHGETLDNAAGVWQGLRDSELSPVGLAQAEKAAPVLATYDPQLLVTSDLVRARVTAEQMRRRGSPWASIRDSGRSTWGSGRVGRRPRCARSPPICSRPWVGLRTSDGEVPEKRWPSWRRESGRPWTASSPCWSRGGWPWWSVTVWRRGPVSPRSSGWTRCRRSRCSGDNCSGDNCHWAVLAEASLVSGALVPPRWRIDAWNISA
ncbi:MAG: histidine phosphatase family protein [Lapillicoccus sp.]